MSPKLYIHKRQTSGNTAAQGGVFLLPERGERWQRNGQRSFINQKHGATAVLLLLQKEEGMMEGCVNAVDNYRAILSIIK